MRPRAASSPFLLFALLAGVLSVLACGGASEEETSGSSDITAPRPPSTAGQMSLSEEVASYSRTVDPQYPPVVRLFAVQQLVQRGTPDAVPALTRAMEDPDERVALAAIEGLPDTSDARAIATLELIASGDSKKLGPAARKRLRALQ